MTAEAGSAPQAALSQETQGASAGCCRLNDQHIWCSPVARLCVPEYVAVCVCVECATIKNICWTCEQLINGNKKRNLGTNSLLQNVFSFERYCWLYINIVVRSEGRSSGLPSYTWTRWVQSFAVIITLVMAVHTDGVVVTLRSESLHHVSRACET